MPPGDGDGGIRSGTGSQRYGEAAVRVIRRAPPTRLTEKSLGLFHDAAGEQAGVGHLDRFGAAEARASGGSGVWRRTRLWD